MRVWASAHPQPGWLKQRRFSAAAEAQKGVADLLERLENLEKEVRT
jgi:hypothetical protein